MAMRVTCSSSDRGLHESGGSSVVGTGLVNLLYVPWMGFVGLQAWTLIGFVIRIVLLARSGEPFKDAILVVIAVTAAVLFPAMMLRIAVDGYRVVQSVVLMLVTPRSTSALETDRPL
jgi:hypothetical protein